MKRFLHIAAFTAGLILILCTAAILAVQTSYVQAALANAAISRLEERTDGSITFSKLHIKPFNALVLKDVSVVDTAPPTTGQGEVIDTLFSARYVIATFSLRGLIDKGGIHIRRAYIGDAQLNLVSDTRGMNLKRVLGLGAKDKEKKEQGNVFDMARIEVQGLRFRLVNLRKPHSDSLRTGAIDWNDLDVVTDIKGRGVRMAKGYMSGTAEQIAIREKSGLDIARLSGSAKVGHGKTEISDLRLKDAFSDLSLPTLGMAYESTKSFSNFTEEVSLSATIRQSVLSSKTLAYFAPAMGKMSPTLSISKADIEGSVNNLNINAFDFTEIGSGVSGGLTGRLSGLPVATALNTDVAIKDLRFDTEGLGRFIGSLGAGGKTDLSKFAPGHGFTFNGNCEGPLQDLGITGELLSDGIGSLSTELRLSGLGRKGSAMGIGGQVSTDGLDIGEILGSKALGVCTLDAGIAATLAKGNPTVRLEKLTVKHLRALGYDYGGIEADGVLSNSTVEATVFSGDPNLQLALTGRMELPKEGRTMTATKLSGTVTNADLNALHIDKRGTSKLAFDVEADYKAIGGADYIGGATLTDLTFEDSKGRHSLGDVTLSSSLNGRQREMSLRSSFLQGDFSGTKGVGGFVDDLVALTVAKEYPVFFKDRDTTWTPNTYEASVRLRKPQEVLSYILPGLYVADSTRIDVRIYEEGLVNVTASSPRLAYNNMYIKGMYIDLDNSDDNISGSVTGEEIKVAPLTLRNSTVFLLGEDDHIGLGLSYDNQTELGDKGEVFLRATLRRDAGDSLCVIAETFPGNIYYEGGAWVLNPSEITVRQGEVTVDNLVAEYADQRITVDGGFSKRRADTLSVSLNKFDIGILGEFLGSGYSLEGMATGNAALISPVSGTPNLLMSLRCDSTAFAGERLGTLSLESASDSEGAGFRFHVSNSLDGGYSVNALGLLDPKASTLDASVDLNGLSAACAAPLLSSVFSDMTGRIHGHVTASGPLKDLTLSSSGGRFEDVGLTLGFTKVPYRVNGPFHIDTEGLHFDDVSIDDRSDGHARLRGMVSFGGFKSLGLDIGLNLNQIEALNTTASDNSSFYGEVYASGSVTLTGPLNALSLNVNASTAKSGALHIPLGNTMSKSSNLLTFKEEEAFLYIDPYDAMMETAKKEKGKSANDMAISLNVRVNPMVQALIEIDSELGNALSCTGSGNIRLDVRPSRGVFTINGDYNISDGNFHFNAMNIAQRDFTIEDGSSVRFTGDVMDSELSVDALYTTKTSLSTLLADTSAVSSRRTVECGLHLSDKLSNPQLSFSIEIPDLDPTTQAQVESALNTEDKIQKQFLSLLISNSFLPDEQSGIVNNTNLLYSNVAEVMAGQLNNILQKLDIPLDLGLNYQSNDSGNDIFDVALSTQLFNNRVIVNGTIGNKQYSNSGSNSNDVVGDLDIDVKLNRQGNLRLNLFSHSADQYTNYLDNSQRNGVGITYQREFNRFGDFLRSLFTGRRRRERMMEERRRRDTLERGAPVRDTALQGGPERMPMPPQRDSAARAGGMAAPPELPQKTIEIE